MTVPKNRVCPLERAGSLDSRFRRWFQNPRRLLGPYLKEGMTVLDFGCGPGFFTLDIARLVGPAGRVIAVDLQEGMLQKLRAKIQGTELEARITLHQCEQSRIGVAQKVAFALAFYALHELPDQRAFFKEVRRMLAPRGLLLVVEPPFRVSRVEFEETLRTAHSAGFTIADRPLVLFSKAALLK